ncbi:MAG: DMT family transporter [Actinobacteria bacterium]|nr:DMT family transporter [Actinomycetota bacterium]
MGAGLSFAVAAAVLLGTSDFFAARSARTTKSIIVTRTAVATSAVLSPLLLLVVDSQWRLQDTVLGAVGGLTMITGLMLLYHGYSVARMGVVAPLSSVLLATVPVVWDLVNGVRPGLWSGMGMAIGAVALVLTSYVPGGSGSTTRGALLGLASGVAFGIAFTVLGQVSEPAGLAPVVVQRTTGLALLLVIGALRRQQVFAEGLGRSRAVIAGLFGLVAIAALQLAFRDGEAGPVSVASSQFATVAVVLSVLFNRERMRWWQAVGVMATALAVALIAVGN